MFFMKLQEEAMNGEVKFESHELLDKHDCDNRCLSQLFYLA